MSLPCAQSLYQHELSKWAKFLRSQMRMRPYKENKVKFSRVCVVYSASVAVHLQPVVDLSDDQQLALGRQESKNRCAEIFKAFEHFEVLQALEPTPEVQMFRHGGRDNLGK